MQPPERPLRGQLPRSGVRARACPTEFTKHGWLGINRPAQKKCSECLMCVFVFRLAEPYSKHEKTGDNCREHFWDVACLPSAFALVPPASLAIVDERSFPHWRQTEHRNTGPTISPTPNQMFSPWEVWNLWLALSAPWPTLVDARRDGIERQTSM